MKGNDRYLGNPNLPTSQAEFEYSPEMIKEINKCKQNILHFAENHFYIVNLDVGRIKIKLHPYQKRILRSLRDNRFVCLLSSRQAGKCLKDNTLCKIRNKKTGKIEELTIKQIYNIAKQQSFQKMT